jgi:hypothetical protein
MIGDKNQENLDAYFAKIVGLKKGSEELYFEFRQKNESTGGYDVLDIKERTIGGYLVEIKAEEREFEGDTIQSIKLYLKDPDERQLIILSIGLNGISRTLLNGMLGTANLNGFWKLTLYKSKENGMPNLWAEVDGEKLEWKYDWNKDFKPKINVIKKGKKTENDYSDLNEWLFEQAKELSKAFKPEGVPDVVADVTTVSPPLEMDDDELTEEDENNLPF